MDAARVCTTKQGSWPRLDQLGCADKISDVEGVAARTHLKFFWVNVVSYLVPSFLQWHERAVFAFILDRRLNAVSIRAALSAALAACLIPTGTAQAELFGPQYRSWEGYEYAPFSPHDRSWGTGDYEPVWHKRQRAHTKQKSRPNAESQRQRAPKSNESEPKAKSQVVANGPLQIIISIADQRISVYDDGTLIARSSISTGVQGHPTPLGVFSIIGKELLASLKYLQRRPHALHAADHLVRDRAACRCLAWPSGFTRLHSLGKRLCDSTLASNEARHKGNHCAPRCPSDRNSEPAPFFKTEDRVQFAGFFG
jgi:L,D-transpeptidase catalytic domain